MTQHHATLLRNVGSTTKHQLFQSCQVGNIGPNHSKSIFSDLIWQLFLPVWAKKIVTLTFLMHNFW